jgi:hypothetical protein
LKESIATGIRICSSMFFALYGAQILRIHELFFSFAPLIYI